MEKTTRRVICLSPDTETWTVLENIKMRISVHEHPHLAKYCRAFIDSKEVTTDCIWADDVIGECLLLNRNDNRHAYLDSNGEVATKIVKGKVDIILMGNAPKKTRAGFFGMVFASRIRRELELIWKLCGR